MAGTPSFYVLQGATSATGPWTNVATNISGTASSYTVQGLVPGVTYYWRLQADNSFGNSAFTSVLNHITNAQQATVTPLIPGTQYKTFQATAATVNLSLPSAPSASSSIFVFFNGYGAAQNSGAITAPTGSTTIAGPIYTTSEVMWCWQVPYTATNSWTFSNYDSTDQAANFKIIEVSNANTYDVTSGAVSTATATAIGWPLSTPALPNCLRLSLLSIQNAVTVGNPSTGITKLLVDPTSETYHQGVLLKVDPTTASPGSLAITGGFVSDPDGYINLNIYGTAPPGTVTGLTSSNITSNSVALAWAALPNVLSYSVEQSTDGGTTWTQGLVDVTVLAAATNTTVTGLAGGKPYLFRVVGNNASGSGTPSTTVSVTTLQAPALSYIQSALGVDQTLAGTITTTLSSPTTVGNTLVFYVSMQNTTNNLALQPPVTAQNIVLPTPDSNTTNAQMMWTQPVTSSTSTFTFGNYSGTACFGVVEVQGVQSIDPVFQNQSLSYSDGAPGSITLPVTAPTATPAIGIYGVNMSFGPDSWGTMPSNIILRQKNTGNSATPTYQYHSAAIFTVDGSVTAGNYTIPDSLGGTFTQQNQNVGTTPNPQMAGINLLGTTTSVKPGTTTLSFSNVTTTSIDLTWPAATSATSYVVKWSTSPNMT